MKAKTADEILDMVAPFRHTTGYIPMSAIQKAIEIALSESSKYSDLEKQVEELLAVTGCGNLREVIGKFSTDKIKIDMVKDKFAYLIEAKEQPTPYKVRLMKESYELLTEINKP